MHSCNYWSNIVTTFWLEPQTSYAISGCLIYCAKQHLYYTTVSETEIKMKGE